MRLRTMWYLATLVALVLLPLAGCGGKAGSIQGEKGTQITVSGVVDGKASAKQLAAFVNNSTFQNNTITVVNSLDGSVLGSGAVASDGSFNNLTFTLPSTKNVLVFVAKVAQGTFRTVLPIDLSNPPAAGTISGNNAISINISQQSSALASVVSNFLGLTGTLGDSGQTLAAAGSNYVTAAQLVVSNGGQSLSYTGSGLSLVGKVNTDALPAVDAGTLTADDLNNIAINGANSKIISAFIPGKKAIVNFQVVNKGTGKGITGLRTFGLHIAQLKPETAGANSYWLNYILNSSGNPTSDAASTFNTDGSLKTQGYQVIDHGDGSYTAIFGTDISAVASVPYDKTLVHRIAISVRSVAVPGGYTGPINPATGSASANFAVPNVAALIYDFTPATGAMLADSTGKQLFARDNVNIAACNKCHDKLGFSGGHFASRPDVKLCEVCHTPQNTSGEGDFTTFIHRIHMGEELPAPVLPEYQAYPNLKGTGGSANSTNTTWTYSNGKTARMTTLVGYEATYPQDIRNCTMCHTGGTDSDNWKSKPTRKVCGSCHNDLNFASGHSGPLGSAGAQTDDTQCATCHAATAAIGADKIHLPIAAPDPNNVFNVYYNTYGGVFSSYSAAVAAGPAPGNSNTNAAYTLGASTSRLPAGAKAISYVISGVTRDSAKHPTITFKFQVQTADSNGVLGAAQDVVFNDPTVKSELIDGFVGGPSVYFGYAVPQDGITSPADYNASASGYLKRIWNGTAKSISGAAADATMTGPVGGYYTVTLTGVTIPDSAVMLTGGLGYTYGLGSVKSKPDNAKAATDPYVPFVSTTMPLTQTDLAAFPYDSTTKIGGLSVPAQNVWKVATNYTGRRLIVDNAKCNNCHGRLGVTPTFHAGQRNDAPTCTFCHNVHRVNSGWAVNIKEAVHAIHAGAKRSNKFSWEATAGDKYWEITYPGYLRDCEQCHVAGMYDFSSSAYTAKDANGVAVLDRLLYSDGATGKYASPNTYGNAFMVILTGTETVTNTSTVLSPFVVANTDYGKAFSATATTQDATYANNLVSSPISAACFSCHDTAVARSHMKLNGGSIYEPRGSAIATKETCLVCHGTAQNTLNGTVPAIKAVHRWW